MMEKRGKLGSSSAFAQWCQTTCYHGVYDFYEAKNTFVKLVWLTAVVLGCFFAVNQSVEFILDFALEDEWQASISSETPPGNLMTWPNLTLCTPNFLSVSVLEKYGWTNPSDVALLTSGKIGRDFYLRMQDPYPENRSADSNFTEYWLGNGTPILEPLTQGCNETILHCGRNAGFDFDLNCNCSEISVKSDEPKCFMINPMKIGDHFYEFQRPGYESGIQFLLNPRVGDYYPTILFDERPTAGLNLLIYFGDTDDDPSISTIFMAPGTHTVVAMTAERHRTKARSSRFLNFYTKQLPCAAEIKYKWLTATTPSRSLCQIDCYVQFSMDLCNCNVKMFPMATKPTARPCRDAQKCIDKIKNLQNKSEPLPSGFNIKRCAEHCKHPCQFDTIATKVSTAQFPASTKLSSFTKYLNRAYRNRAGANFSEDETRGLILLELFYETGEYKVIERINRVSLDLVISNIGGTLGVWTGLSVIGIFQAFMYVLYGLRKAARKLLDAPKAVRL